MHALYIPYKLGHGRKRHPNLASHCRCRSRLERNDQRATFQLARMSGWADLLGDAASSDDTVSDSVPEDGHVVGPEDDFPLKEWWRFVRAATAGRRAQRGAQMRALAILSLCTGLCSESMACEALDIDADLVATCDPKPISKQVLDRRPFGMRPLHHFQDVFTLLADAGTCVVHGVTCTLDAADILIAGFPCQPYSKQNAKRNRDGGPASNPLFSLTKAMVDAVRLFEPYMFLFENVAGFAEPIKGQVDTPLGAFVHALQAVGRYIVMVVYMHLSDWVVMSRSRFRA